MKTRLHRYFLPVLVLLGALPALAGEKVLTPFYGQRWGGQVETISIPTETFDFSSSESYGLMFDIEVDIDTFIEILWTHQPTDVEARLTGEEFDVDVDYFMVGAMHEFDDDGIRPFVGGGLGLAYYSPKRSGLSSASRLAFYAGGGFRTMFGTAERIGIRVDARIYGTFVNTGGGFWCSGGSGGGGCSVGFTASDIIFQGEVTAGLSLAFGN